MLYHNEDKIEGFVLSLSLYDVFAEYLRDITKQCFLYLFFNSHKSQGDLTILGRSGESSVAKGLTP